MKLSERLQQIYSDNPGLCPVLEPAINEAIRLEDLLVEVEKEMGPVYYAVMSLQASMLSYHASVVELAETAEEKSQKDSKMHFADGIKWSLQKLQSLLIGCGWEEESK